MSFLSRDPREKKKTLHAHDKRGLPNARGSWEGSNIGSWEEVEWVARAGQGRVFARIRWSRLLLGSVKVKRYSSKQSKIKNHNSKLIICCGFSSSVRSYQPYSEKFARGHGIDGVMTRRGCNSNPGPCIVVRLPLVLAVGVIFYSGCECRVVCIHR